MVQKALPVAFRVAQANELREATQTSLASVLQA
jgi:hypothetical protein